MQQLGFFRHAQHRIFCQVKDSCTNFLVCLHFLITFSGLFRHNYIMLHILWKIEVCRIQIWQNHIEKCKWRRIRTIRVWKIWSPLTELFSTSYYKCFSNVFISMDGSYCCLTRFYLKKFSIGSLIRNENKCWFWDFSLAISVYNLS